MATRSQVDELGTDVTVDDLHRAGLLDHGSVALLGVYLEWERRGKVLGRCARCGRQARGFFESVDGLVCQGCCG